MEPIIPKNIGPYDILGVIAEGGMATVYRGIQPSLDRPVAIKVLSHQLSSDEDTLARFQREARTVAKLSHANVIQVIDYGVSDEGCFIVMECIEGASLDAIIGSGITKIYQAVTIALQVAVALEHAHSRGVIHRDIKPGNILLDGETGHVKVTDFGIAQLTNPELSDRTLTKANVALGSLDYMSPEQRRQGAQVDERTDIFAFGVLMYEMISGHTPVGRFRELQEVRDDISPALSNLVQRCLREDPEDRYASFTEVISELDKLSKKELAYRETITRLVDLVVNFPRKITGQVERTPAPSRRPLLVLVAVPVGIILLIAALILLPKLIPGTYGDQFDSAQDFLEIQQYDEALNQLRGIRTAAGAVGETAAAAKAQWRIAKIHEERQNWPLAAVAYAYYASTFSNQKRQRHDMALFKAGQFKMTAGDPVAAAELLGRLTEESSSLVDSKEYQDLAADALYQSAFYLQEEVRPARKDKQRHWQHVVDQYQSLLNDFPHSKHRENAYWQLAALLDNRKEVRNRKRCASILEQMAVEFPTSQHFPLFVAAEIARNNLDDPQRARRLYEKFLIVQPNSPQAPSARRRLNDL